MKKIVLASSALLFLSFIGNAQIKKGFKLLGGSFSFQTGESQYDNIPNTNSKNMSVYLGPMFGIAIRENLVAGVRLTYGQQTSKQAGGNAKNVTNIYGGEVFARKYLPIANKIYLVGEGEAYFNKSQQETKSSFPSPKTNGMSTGLSFSPSIAFAVSKNFHLEAGLGNLLNLNYSVSKSRDESFPGNNQTSHSFAFSSWANTQVPVNIGFRIFLGK